MGYTAGLTLGEHIGSGFFGDVHQAVDEVRGLVAVKIFRRQDDEPDGFWRERQESLLDEGRKLALAEHPNIVKVHQALRAADDQSILLVMELCPGGSLEPMYKAGPMTFHRVREVVTQASLGLQALHARDLLHRDIKPSNLLLGADGVVRIGDFGLVTDDVVLGYGSANGYGDHLAPEVMEGNVTSIRTDIWALGMTMYRLLHGDAWYRSYLGGHLDAVGQGGFSRRLRWLPHVPPEWRRFIRRCLHDDPAHRVRDASDFLAGLARLPVDPDWDCTVHADTVSWMRRKGSRTISAHWTGWATRREHRWSATSSPTSGAGRDRRLGGAGPLSRSAAVSDLDGFFRDA